ncbi:ABC transporter permease [Pseudooceanicola algae]|uniref:ABC transmembrane type-1 domain-containing protein n=1 Tax=Pseudooceanicola algae TaxID=1537215 RepID=A0A418SFE4_9RHOB|nr:iron ABC transporter permease [Pseudooceanicola algae]QPM89199.1 hypothetical protein PSAL_004120 [Pseudooceanicola algae]
MIRNALRGEGISLAALCLFALLLFVMPLGLLFRLGLAPDGVPSLAPLAGALESDAVRRALWRSLVSASLSGAGALVIGTALALAIGLTDLRRKGAQVFVLLLPMMIPPHVTAIAWIQALGPASPILLALGIAPEPGSTHPLYSGAGVILLLTLQHAPLVFLVVLSALRGLPRELTEAARLAGARPNRLLARILLPLLAPALLAGFTLAFISALGNFGIPALLGIPARYTTLPVLIWRRLASFGPGVLGDVAMISMLLALVAVVAIWLQGRLQRRLRSGLIGLAQAPMLIRLGAWRGPVAGALVVYMLMTLALPLAALISTALVPTYGVRLTFDTATLANFGEVLLRQSVTLRAFANSAMAAGLAGLLLAGLSVLLAHQAGRRGRGPRRTAGGIFVLAEIAYAIPGLVISIAFILAFIRPIPFTGLSLYNTLAIICLAYLTAFFSVALKPVAAAYGQLDPGIEDAARVSGARFGRRLWRIILPLLAPAAGSGAILVFLTAYNEVTVSALLWSTGNETIGTVIFNYEDGGYTVLAAAMASVTVAVTVLLMLLLDWLGRRLPPGVVPWRL